MAYMYISHEITGSYADMHCSLISSQGRLNQWAYWAPPAERGPSLESIYRVSLTVDLCEG